MITNKACRESLRVAEVNAASPCFSLCQLYVACSHIRVYPKSVHLSCECAQAHLQCLRDTHNIQQTGKHMHTKTESAYIMRSSICTFSGTCIQWIYELLNGLILHVLIGYWYRIRVHVNVHHKHVIEIFMHAYQILHVCI